MHRVTSLLFLAATLAACGTTVSGGGTGGSDSGGSPSGSTAPGAGPLDCGAHDRCAGGMLGDDVRACEAGTECVLVPGCVTAICVATEDACAHICSGGCFILESYPAQIDCDGGTTEALDEVTCDEVTAELATIQSCTADDECGLVLENTSCGCTRELVARLDAPVAIFEALREAATECGFGGTCDCPEADGFACVDGTCAWKYVD